MLNFGYYLNRFTLSVMRLFRCFFTLRSSPAGLSGGFIKANTSLANNTVIIPDNNKDSFAFTGSSQLVNTTNSTINCRVFVGNTVYYGRFQSFGSFEYRDNDYNYTWHSVTINKIIDLNIFPKSDNKANQNLHIN